VRVIGDELWLEGAHIDEYREGNRHNHEATRRRRLLAHKREIRRWGQRMKEKGLTVVALRLYFRGRHAKLEIGLARGRKSHDKREQLRERDAKREMRNLRRR
ncbi:MAG: SsrA-binding protein, partial [Planctomycetes bacterium]|nr:SsrA-binding protein [Planctomycetota bacterium]